MDKISSRDKCIVFEICEPDLRQLKGAIFAAIQINEK